MKMKDENNAAKDKTIVQSFTSARNHSKAPYVKKVIMHSMNN